jgi:hypothetical protein
MLKKVCKARLPDLLAGGAHVVSNVYMHYRVAVVLMYNKSEPVGQNIFLVRDHDLIAIFVYFFYQPGL